jgi:hypothetical protein
MAYPAASSTGVREKYIDYAIFYNNTTGRKAKMGG